MLGPGVIFFLLSTPMDEWQSDGWQDKTSAQVVADMLGIHTVLLDCP
jgi:hypothetical protein